jgi:hypothetical protein
MAKGATKDKKFNPSSVEKFKEISFHELYGLFKVIKSIQLAKNYTSDPTK